MEVKTVPTAPTRNLHYERFRLAYNMLDFLTCLQREQQRDWGSTGINQPYKTQRTFISSASHGGTSPPGGGLSECLEYVLGQLTPGLHISRCDASGFKTVLKCDQSWYNAQHTMPCLWMGSSLYQWKLCTKSSCRSQYWGHWMLQQHLALMWWNIKKPHMYTMCVYIWCIFPCIVLLFPIYRPLCSRGQHWPIHAAEIIFHHRSHWWPQGCCQCYSPCRAPSLLAQAVPASSGFFSIPHSQEEGELEKISLSEAIFLHPEQPHHEIICPAIATWLLRPSGPACHSHLLYSQMGCWVLTALLLESNTHYASQLCTLSFFQPGLCRNGGGRDVDVS